MIISPEPLDALRVAGVEGRINSHRVAGYHEAAALVLPTILGAQSRRSRAEDEGQGKSSAQLAKHGLSSFAASTESERHPGGSVVGMADLSFRDHMTAAPRKC
jgi:hypothetical protein